MLAPKTTVCELTDWVLPTVLAAPWPMLSLGDWKRAGQIFPLVAVVPMVLRRLSRAESLTLSMISVPEELGMSLLEIACLDNFI